MTITIETGFLTGASLSSYGIDSQPISRSRRCPRYPRALPRISYDAILRHGECSPARALRQHDLGRSERADTNSRRPRLHSFLISGPRDGFLPKLRRPPEYFKRRHKE
jgi:hypothetical protein